MKNLTNSGHYIIAIDGHSSCGKSTLAKDLADQLGFTYINTGAMYRAVTIYLLNNNIDIDIYTDYSKLLSDQVSIRFETVDNTQATYLNDRNVESMLKEPNVASNVSDVAANSSIRRFLVSSQRELGKASSVIMDGRDIASVVFPDADVKLFVTADVDIRAKRRYQELLNKGIKTTYQEVKANLEKRDHIDSTRSDSPLVQVDDAILIDTSHHTRTSQMEEALEIILSKIKK